MSSRWRVSALYFLCLAPACSFGAGEYTFTLDGEPIFRQHWGAMTDSLNGTPGDLRPGDVVHVGSLSIVLGEPGHYAFRKDPERKGVLLLEKDGRTRATGACIRMHSRRFVADVQVNPLSGMTRDEIHALRGIRLEMWSDEIARQLEHIDPKRTCISTRWPIVNRHGVVLPLLPKGLHYLKIDRFSPMDRAGRERLAEQTELQYLVVAGRGLSTRQLNAHRELRFLDATAGSPTAGAPPHEPVQLPQLRGLRLRGAKLAGIPSVSSLPRLRVLDISSTGVTDLSPLAGLQNLARVIVSGAPVRTLPRGTLPSLVHVEALGTKLRHEDVLRFSKANPQCRVLLGWNELLRWKTSGATRLEVAGCTKHVWSTLFEVKGEDRVKRLVHKIVVREEDNECMCCNLGFNSVRFYRGEALLAELHVHDPCHMRMAGWPGRVFTLPDSMEFPQRWLAQNGVPVHTEGWNMMQGVVRELRLARSRYNWLIPASVAKRLSPVEPTCRRAVAFEKGLPDPVARAGLCLRLIEHHGRSWRSHPDLYTLVTEWVLPEIAPKHIAAAARVAIAGPGRMAAALRGPLSTVFPEATHERIAAGLWAADEYPPGVDGAARWLFEDEGWRTLDPGDLDALLTRLAEIGLSHPQMYNRRRTLGTLAEIGSPAAVAAIRKCLEGRIAVRALPEGEWMDTADRLSVGGRNRKFSAKCSDGAIAGLFLAEMGERAILPELRRRIAQAGLADREILKEAIDMLTAPPEE